MADMIPASRIVAVVNTRVSEALASLKTANVPSYSTGPIDTAIKALDVASELLALVNGTPAAPVQGYGDLTDPRTKGMPPRLPEFDGNVVRPMAPAVTEAPPAFHTLTAELVEPAPLAAGIYDI